MRTQTTTNSMSGTSRKPSTPAGGKSGGGISSSNNNHSNTNNPSTGDPLSAMMTRVKRSPSTSTPSSSSLLPGSRRSSGEILTGAGNPSYNQEGTSGVVRKSSSSSSGLPPISGGGGGGTGQKTASSISNITPVATAVTTTTTTRRSSVAGKNLPAKRTITDFGMTVDEAGLERFKLTKKNTSPFDSNMFLPMLKPCPQEKTGKITLVLDIDETMVHSSLKPRDGTYLPDTVVAITAGGQTGNIYVKYRPHLMTFLEAVEPLFEVVVFTASQSQYANQLMDTIDPKKKFVTDRLFREHCTEVNGARVKDLTLLGRPLERMVILDNSPVAYLFQQRNAIPILSWFDDPSDTELLKLIPFLQDLSLAKSVYPMLDMYNTHALAMSSKTNSPSSPAIHGNHF